MQEFTKFATEPSLDTSEMFNEFKNSHGKNYDDENEHKKRKNIFKHNMRQEIDISLLIQLFIHALLHSCDDLLIWTIYVPQVFIFDFLLSIFFSIHYSFILF